MRDFAGIVRSNKRLQNASKQLQQLYEEIEAIYKISKLNTELCELRNMINVAHLIINQSIERRENKGGFFSTDNFEKSKYLQNDIS